MLDGERSASTGRAGETFSQPCPALEDKDRSFKAISTGGFLWRPGPRS
jgi:hypothetical protein